MKLKTNTAKSKRNNQKYNKLVKKGIIKKASKDRNLSKRVQAPKIVKNTNNNDEEEHSNESDYGEDMLEMVENDDIDFLKEAITNRSYSFLNKVKYFGPSKPKRCKLRNEDETLENEYEEQIEDNSNQKVKMLLPIKTKTGFVTREFIETIEDGKTDEDVDDKTVATENSELQFEEEFSLEDNELDLSKPISTAQMLAARNEVLRQKKVHIGTLSSGLLENPEEKVTNLRTLLKLMDDELPETYFSIKKLVIISLLEVFKDILPSYEIKNIKSDAKLKKDTLKLQKYEENLLQYYKKFLQKLEKYSMLLIRKKGDARKHSEETLKLAELSVQVMCELLMAHPYFNFAHNIAHAVVPFLISPNKNVREIVKNAIKTVFKEDKKEEITLKILQITNNYLKTHSHNVNSGMLEILLVLNLSNVNLDQEKEHDIKQKKINAKKQNILQMSKKERKRKKKLQELEKEMLETKAEENRQAKHKKLTEITKIVFNIYFRILKFSSNTKVLGVCLEGLAKFAHCINLEYYIDIVNVLDGLLKEEWLGYREKLHCIQTIFTMLSGQGEALNLDPTRFYNILYKDLLTNIRSREDVFLIALKTLTEALVKRRKKITAKRTLGFVKRLATLGLQVVPNETLSCLCLIKTIMQLNRSVDILLDVDGSVGDGKFQVELDDPEYANAGSTALFEMIMLSRHYHPAVAKYAKHIASGVPTTGNGSLPPEYSNLNPEQLFTDFSMSEMAFNPPVPVPKKVQPKSRSAGVIFADGLFKDECRTILNSKRPYNPFSTFISSFYTNVKSK